MTDKSATERLREMLDECGVEWWETINHANCVFTWWESPIFGMVHAMDNEDGETLFMACLNNIDFTPEQAIAATLGGGECEVVASYDTSDVDSRNSSAEWYFAFSCGHELYWDEGEPPKHCPECGAKIRKAVKR